MAGRVFLLLLTGAAKMKIGIRIIKTGIAVTITMYLCQLFNLEPALFGAISAVVNMQPSLYLTLKTARDQIIIHVIGVAIGLAAGYLFGGSPVIMGAVTVCIIFLYTKLKIQSGILMGMVAAIFILNSPPDQFLMHAFTRSYVIFTGLFVAMIINATLWPPRYGNTFIEMLRQCNDKSVDYFCQAVHDFTRLDNEEILLPSEKRAEVIGLNKECRVIAKYCRREKITFGNGYGYINPNNWFYTTEKFLSYNDALVEKADQIYELLPGRLERRIKTGAPPISNEFNCLLEILNSGCITIKRVNSKLQASICDGQPVEPEKISEVYWVKLKGAIEEWLPRLYNSYHLHALIEISVVASDIRWLGREGKKLLRETYK